jgi:Phage capsid family
MATLEELGQELAKSDAELKTKLAEMRVLVEKQEKEMADLRKAQATPETAKRIDDLDTKLLELAKAQAQIGEAITAEGGKREGLFRDVQKRLDELQADAQRRGAAAAGEVTKTAGQAFVEVLAANRDEIASKIGQRGSLNGTPGAILKSFAMDPAFRGIPQRELQKALTTGMTTNMPPVVWAPEMLLMPKRDLRVRQLIPSFTTSQPMGGYHQQIGFHPATATSVTSITRSGQVATVTITGHGFQDFDRIRIAGAGQTEYNVDAFVRVLTANTFTYTVAGSPATPATGTITALRLNNYGNARFVAEGGTKPEANMSFQERTWKVEVLAHWIQMTRQFMDDLPQTAALVDGDLLYGLAATEEYALLYGSGVSPEIQGILTTTGIQQFKWSEGKTGDKPIDTLRRARTRLELALAAQVSGAVVHPFEWEDMETAKGSDGHYLWVQAMGGLGQSPAPWRIPLVVSPLIKPGTMLVGDWSTGFIQDREMANVRVAEFDGSDFIQNKVKVLAEQRIGAGWRRPEHFCLITLDSAPA